MSIEALESGQLESSAKEPWPACKDNSPDATAFLGATRSKGEAIKMEKRTKERTLIKCKVVHLEVALSSGIESALGSAGQSFESRTRLPCRHPF